MEDYRKMYYVLCKAIDDVIDPLEHIPLMRKKVVSRVMRKFVCRLCE